MKSLLITFLGALLLTTNVIAVDATVNYDNPKIVMEASKKLKDAMKGLDISEIPEDQMFQERGW